jgi:hypothetical protein
MAELRRLQAERTTAASEPDIDAFPNEKALFASLDAGFVRASIAAQLALPKEVHENGFDFSNDAVTQNNAALAVLNQEAA